MIEKNKITIISIISAWYNILTSKFVVINDYICFISGWILISIIINMITTKKTKE